MKLPTKIQEWRPIEGFPGYEVSNWGRVRRWYADSRGVGFCHNLKIHVRNKTVGLERVKDSRNRVHRTVASLQLAAFPESEGLKAAV